MSIRRSLVGAVAGLSVLVAASTGGAGASAAPITPDAPPSGSSVTKVPAPLLSRSDAARSGTGDRQQTPKVVGDARAAGSTADVVELPGYCPSGKTPGTAINLQSFEGALPYPADSYGFAAVRSGVTTHGTWHATSTISAGVPILAYVNSTHVPVPRGTTLGMSFSYKGSTAGDTIGFSVNNSGGGLEPAANWTRVALDVTSEAATNAGFLDAFFFNDTTADTSARSSLQVDEVRVYTCVPVPYTRGDFSGDGKVDLLATNTDPGDLVLFGGNGNGTISSPPRLVGKGWSSFTWLASPGDVDGDRRTDLLARRGDGTMLLYYGRGNGGFSSAVTVGTGWNVISAIATPGDVTLDGRPEVLGRTTDGSLHLYTFGPGGQLKRLKQIGTGWNSTRLVIGRGDLNGDRRGDLIGIRTDGTMWSYTINSSLAYGKAIQVGSGWNTMTHASSPGSLNGPGFDDIVGRHSDGSLWFYAGGAGGGLGKAVKIATGWNAYSNFL